MTEAERVADPSVEVVALLGPLGSYPPYFRRLGEVNRVGPAVLAHAPGLTPPAPAEVRRLLAGGAQLVDTRGVGDFAAAHVPDASSIPLRPVFASWLGWLAPDDRPLLLVRGADQDPREIAWQAATIGYTDLAGELTGGLDAWLTDGHPTAGIRLVQPDQIEGHVLDVRQRAEFEAGHLPGAQHIELGALAQRIPEVPHVPTVVMCGHGERAMGAASQLEAAGRQDLAVLTGGPDAWSSATGRPLHTGS